MTRSILILKSDFHKEGGAEKYARHLAAALHARGDKVTVLTTGEKKPAPFEILYHPLKGKTSVSKTLEFENLCKNYCNIKEYDIIFGHDRNTFQTHIRAGSGVHKAFLDHRRLSEPKWKAVRHRFNPLHRLLLQIEKQSFENPYLQVLFTNSQLVKKEILTHYQTPEDKITVIHNGVDWHKWQTPFNAWEEIKKSAPIEFLFMGNNFERKGLIPLLMALKNLDPKDYHLSVVGTDKNEKKFQTLAEGQNVTFYGPQKEIAPFFQKADCLVIPSYYDPFANVTIEALAMGLFVVSSKTNGGSEILTPQTGTVIEDLSSPLSVTNALKLAMEHPKTKATSSLIRNSVQNLDFSIQLGKYLEKLV